jgi:hypothetical protein
MLDSSESVQSSLDKVYESITVSADHFWEVFLPCQMTESRVPIMLLLCEIHVCIAQDDILRARGAPCRTPGPAL